MVLVSAVLSAQEFHMSGEDSLTATVASVVYRKEEDLRHCPLKLRVWYQQVDTARFGTDWLTLDSLCIKTMVVPDP